ncbi:Trypanosoma vivax [Trypanosoma grayi]|uniref:Trypanosoma vivax n=1 Tax=Trypanosoma grayi TaxID=71804 RepID=UPI0004F48D19|nr:Trypanosoma vivax [Trypanosoma grayi]KEG07450.1 Trypanosoma vivax [Trypanosoma grayi]
MRTDNKGVVLMQRSPWMNRPRSPAAAHGGRPSAGTSAVSPGGVVTPRGRSVPLKVRARSETRGFSSPNNAHADAGGDDGVYQRFWSQIVLRSTSGFMFAVVIAVMYSLYILCLPYGDSISFGILLSVVLHPQSREQCSDSNAARRECVERMRGTQQAWASRTALSGVIGPLASLRHFVSYALMQGVMFLGLNKLLLAVQWRSGRGGGGKVKQNGSKDKKFLIASSNGRLTLRLLTVCIFSVVAHTMIGISFFLGMHAVLFALFALTVTLMSEERFMGTMWRVWRFALVLFFVIGLSYNLALDVLSISDAVKRTTTAVVNAQHEWTRATNSVEAANVSSDVMFRVEEHGTSASMNSTSSAFEFQELVLSKLQQTVLKELADILNHTNATELAVTVRRILTPILSTSPSQFSVVFLKKKTDELSASFFTRGNPLKTVDWVSVMQRMMKRWRPFFVFSTQLLFMLGSNMIGLFDSVYAVMLFVFVLRYFLHLDHTILYYVIAKMLKAIHPRGGEWHARKIEREITVSFLTLLQSFWHLTWFHFCITFCLFNKWSFITPFLCGLVSSLTAVFPLIPKWLSPVAFALLYVLVDAARYQGLLGAAVDPRVWSCLAAFVASYMDEWLLCVSRGLRGNSVRDSSGVEREELPTFVIGTALVLGYVSYGVRGILLGPLTVIVAKVLFDNWDTVSDRDMAASMTSVEQEEKLRRHGETM